MNQKNEKSAKPGDFISKEESVIVSAIAVLLMVFHHLFGFPERILQEYILVLDIPFLHVETILSYLGRICISIFAFSSGYGLTKQILLINADRNIKKSYKLVWNRLKKFYSVYWIVFLVFISLGVAIGRVELEEEELFKNLLGLSSSYNHEWWYVGNYVSYVIIFPILTCINGKFLKGKKRAGYLIMVLVIGFASITLRSSDNFAFFTFLMCFYEGMSFVELSIYEKIYTKVSKCRGLLSISFLFVVLGVILKIAFFTNSRYDYLFAPVFVYGIGVVTKSRWLGMPIRKILMVVGKYSTYIWLTHTFFAYYYFQPLIYLPKYSILILIWCILLTVCTGIVLENVRHILGCNIRKVFSNEN